MASIKPLGPLDWRIPIVTPDGRPTSEFQRRWATQVGNNTQIGSITLGAGPPPVNPVPEDGAQYADTATNPYTMYIAYGGTWNLAGAASDNPTAIAGDVAVPGTADTFMRSDAAPAIQKASASQFGIVKVDGTTITESGGVISAVGGGGGGGGWSLIQSYNIDVSGAIAALDANVSGYSDVLIIMHNITSSAATAFRQVYLSVNGGTSFYNTNGDYVTVPSNGSVANTGSAITHTTQTNAARTVVGLVYNVGHNGSPKLCTSNGGDNRLFVASTAPVNAVRLTGSAGNMTAGQLYVFGR
jgi:hypothetical protein